MNIRLPNRLVSSMLIVFFLSGMATQLLAQEQMFPGDYVPRKMKVQDEGQISSIPKRDDSRIMRSVMEVGNGFHQSNSRPSESIRVASVQPIPPVTRPPVSGQPKMPTANVQSDEMPVLITETLGPQQLRPGQKAEYRISVTNQGASSAEEVRLVFASSSAYRISNLKINGKLYLAQLNKQSADRLAIPLGTVESDVVQVIDFLVHPIRSGEFELMASVHFSTPIRKKISIAQPEIQFEVSGPDAVSVSENVEHKVLVKNNSDETIQRIQLSRKLPHFLASAGNQAVSIENLMPGEMKEVNFESKAKGLGSGETTFNIFGPGVDKRITKQITVHRQTVLIDFQGPDKNQIGQQQTFAIQIANKSEQDHENIQVELQLPEGMVMNILDRIADVDQNRSTYTFSISELAASESHIIRFAASCRSNGAHTLQATVKIAGREVASQTKVTNATAFSTTGSQKRAIGNGSYRDR